MKRPLRCLLVTTIVAAIPVGVAVAGTASEDVPVPGGRAALASAFDIRPVPDRARFISEAARLIHGVPERKAPTPESLAAQLRLAAASGGLAELVPVPLTAAIWSDAIFQRQVSRDDLVVSILGDRLASLLAHGLAGLDDDTLEYDFSQHPALLTQLYTLGPESFTVFASSVHVRGDRVVTPGGDEAVPLWEQIVGDRVTRPDRFISALFTRVDTRIAGLYDTIGQLDPARQRFALGLWIAEPSVRLERMQALAAAAIASVADARTIRTQPFARQPYDLVAALMRVRVDATGRPVEPASRAFWNRAFESPELPEDPARMLATSLESDQGLLDAAWLAGLATTADMRLRAERLDQFAFTQRVFGGVSSADLPDALVGARAFRRYRMLMLTLERIGVRKPATFAAAARVATRLSPPDVARAFVATGQFQGALVLLWRMRTVGTLDGEATDALLESLLAVPINSSAQYLGGIVRWLNEQLRPAIPPADSLDMAIEAAVSGPDERASAPRIEWEGKRYRVDIAAGEAERLRRVREKLGGATLNLATELAASAQRLSVSPAAPGAVQSAYADLTSVAKENFPDADRDGLEADGFPPGVTQPPAPRGSVMKAIDELERSSGGANLPRAARAASELVAAADEAAAQALVALAYAISLGDPEGAALLPGNVSKRHDFGFNQRDNEQRLRAAWMMPRQDVSPGVPWHLDGSLLGLDIGLASSSLRRLSADRALAAPTLNSNDRETFAVTYGLMNAMRLTDAGRDAIAEGIERGRKRMAAATVAEVDTVASELNMDGWRRRAILWTAAHDRPQLESLLSLNELLALGREAGGIDLDAWGTAAIVSDSCVCSRIPPPGGLPLVIGRHQVGLLATVIPDLNLHVARMLAHLRLPARLAKYVLSAAVIDFVDEVRGTDSDDWLSLVRGAAAVPQDRIEDYVAAAAADGPLVMESSK